MKFLHVATASLLASICNGSPLSFAERQAPGSYYAIRGPVGGVHPRLEIRELQKTGDMWNLFLLALTEFEAMNQNEIDSYYQIAGIHGQPWQNWDGVNTIHSPPLPRGYCPHGELLFLQWHRPYISLFEQKLQSIAIGIANQFTGTVKTRYQDAAQKLRLPYWDWATATPTNVPIFPIVLAQERVQVTFPNNSVAQIDNPLFDYNFHPKEASINATGCWPSGGGLISYDSMCNIGVKTVRSYVPNDITTSNYTELERRYRNILRSMRQSTFNSLSRTQEYNTFSNRGTCGPESLDGSGGRSSIETPHNTIHEQMAPGHMVPIAVSAFDPVFWLHHANVDRFMALWQVINPNDFMKPCNQTGVQYTTAANQLLDENTPLAPFHRNAAGDFWTSANSRRIADLGYTYPELVNSPSAANIITIVKNLYSGPATGGPPAAAKRQETTPTPKKDFMANIQIPNLDIAYSLYLFVGDVSGGADDWAGLESFAGITSSLESHGGSKEVSDSIDITYAIDKSIAAGKTTPEGAVEYVKKTLKWRVGSGGKEVSRDKIPGVKISLVTYDVQEAKSESEFDTYTNAKSHGEIAA
ncbi:hypothetical protein B0J11DRAFT_601212 [Dendryphion nanum]|uniref:tyrosinase n=1 Tax=Dendryphion nanum TaxID=256645 RepID=A0A9P9E535_9PLEO|nr:hypothetical protein B0J11DRAFT_601212 [Dendryphion nanum]